MTTSHDRELKKKRRRAKQAATPEPERLLPELGPDGNFILRIPRKLKTLEGIRELRRDIRETERKMGIPKDSTAPEERPLPQPKPRRAHK